MTGHLQLLPLPHSFAMMPTRRIVASTSVDFEKKGIFLMKQFKLAALLFVSAALLSSTAFCHIPMKDEAISAPAPYGWTGFYVGFNVGAERHSLNVTDDKAATFFATIQQVSNPDFIGGGQIGYRRQLDLNKVSGVFGLEFSADFSNAIFKQEYGSPFALYQLSSENELKHFYLLQLMGGIAADRTLLFLAAGVSWTGINGSTINTDGLPFFNSFNVDRQAFGTAVGGGVEYAFNDKISARLKVDVVTPNAYYTFDDAGNSYQISNNIVLGTLGVSYKFG